MTSTSLANIRSNVIFYSFDRLAAAAVCFNSATTSVPVSMANIIGEYRLKKSKKYDEFLEDIGE